MIIEDMNGENVTINEGDKVIITLYDSHNKPITAMNSEAYEPHEVIKRNGTLGVIWGIRQEFTPLSAFVFATFTVLIRKEY